MELDQRLAALEQKVEASFALDARLKAIEDSIRKMNPKSSVRDWIQTLSPFVIAITVFVIGFIFKDSVVQALEREKLDLSYVTNVRQLIQDLDKAEDQSSADSNAIALAMFGKFSIVPLVDRLHLGDGVTHLAAERGLRVTGTANPVAACSAFTKILRDSAHQYAWQTHTAVVRLMGVSDCVPSLPVLEAYLAELEALQDEAQIVKFSKRYSDGEAFDGESIDSIIVDLRGAIAILNLSRDRTDRGEEPWWK